MVYQSKIAVLVPYHRSEPPEVEWHQALQACLEPFNAEVFWCTEVPSIPEAREYLVKQALRTDAEYFLWVDSDTYPPRDGLKLLLGYAQRYGPALYAGAYWTKKPRVEVTLSAWIKTIDPKTGQPAFSGLHPETLNSPNEIIEVDGVGLGFALVHRSIYERVPPPLFCFPEGTIVLAPVPKPIELIKPGDLVFTHKGRLRRVTKTFRRWCPSLLELHASHLPPIQLTPEHPILAKHFRYKDRRGRIYSPPTWLPANYLRPGDRVFIPKITVEEKINVFIDVLEHIPENIRWNIRENNGLLSYIHGGNPLRPANRIPRKIRVTPELCRLLGYYVSEGGTDGKYVTFCFNAKDERHLLNDVIKLMDDIFEIKPWIIEENNGIKARYGSVILSSLFSSLCGKGAENKHFPWWFLNLPSNMLVEMLKSYWWGDGSWKSECYYASSKSKILIHQNQLALLKLGVLPSVYYPKSIKNALLCIPSSQSSRVGQMLEWPEIQTKDRWRRFDETLRGFWVTVTSIRRVPYHGYVYNLEVEEDNSYLAYGMAVHNCWSYDPFLNLGTSEDFFHCDKLKAHGVKIYLCPRVICAHVGKFKMVFLRDPKTGRILPEPVYTMIRDRRPEYVPQV